MRPPASQTFPTRARALSGRALSKRRPPLWLCGCFLVLAFLLGTPGLTNLPQWQDARLETQTLASASDKAAHLGFDKPLQRLSLFSERKSSLVGKEGGKSGNEPAPLLRAASLVLPCPFTFSHAVDVCFAFLLPASHGLIAFARPPPSSIGSFSLS